MAIQENRPEQAQEAFRQAGSDRFPRISSPFCFLLFFRAFLGSLCFPRTRQKRDMYFLPGSDFSSPDRWSVFWVPGEAGGGGKRGGEYPPINFQVPDVRDLVP